MWATPTTQAGKGGGKALSLIPPWSLTKPTSSLRFGSSGCPPKYFNINQEPKVRRQVDFRPTDGPRARDQTGGRTWTEGDGAVVAPSTRASGQRKAMAGVCASRPFRSAQARDFAHKEVPFFIALVEGGQPTYLCALLRTLAADLMPRLSPPGANMNSRPISEAHCAARRLSPPALPLLCRVLPSPAVVATPSGLAGDTRSFILFNPFAILSDLDSSRRLILPPPSRLHAGRVRVYGPYSTRHGA